MAEYQSYSYDVLVIGAGGAGLRAAIEAAASGVKVGVVCKSLLGKAHTVMAEGGVAAALANVDDRDNWRVHFADTMRGGQYLNNWRMAELHAKEAPDRVRELEAWGALFDRTKDGRILQRNFGGHRYPRLAHVGDRTGLEMIRTLQDHGIHQGMEVHMECTVLSLLLDSGRIAGAFGYDREKGHFILWPAKGVVMATGGIGRAFKITSNSWEYTGDGHALAYRAGAELLDMEFVQFHPTGMVWPISVRGILVTEGVRGEGGVLAQQRRDAASCSTISPSCTKSRPPTREEEGWRYTQGDKNARRPPELLTRDHVARCINREVKAGRGSPHGGVFLDIAWIKERIKDGAEHIKRKLPSMYHQFKQLADIDITKVPMEVGPTTHYMMGGIRVDGDTQDVHGARACSRQAKPRQDCTAPTGSAAIRCRTCWCSASEPASSPRISQRQNGAAAVDQSQVDAAAKAALKPFECGPSGENPYQIQYELQEFMQDLVGIVRSRARCSTPLDVIDEACERSAERAGIADHRQYNNGWHTAMDLAEHAGCLGSDHASGVAAQREPRRTVSRGLIRTKIRSGESTTSWSGAARTARCSVEKRPVQPLPAELKTGYRGDEIDGYAGHVSNLARRCGRRGVPGLQDAGR